MVLRGGDDLESDYYSYYSSTDSECKPFVLKCIYIMN